MKINNQIIPNIGSNKPQTPRILRTDYVNCLNSDISVSSSIYRANFIPFLGRSKKNAEENTGFEKTNLPDEMQEFDDAEFDEKKIGADLICVKISDDSDLSAEGTQKSRNKKKSNFDEELQEELVRIAYSKANTLAEREEAKLKLIEHNMRLTHHFAQKFYSPNSWLDYNDLVSLGSFALVKSVDGYDPTKLYNGKPVKFATYASRAIINEIFQAFRKKRLPTESLDQEFDESKIKLSDVIPDDKPSVFTEASKSVLNDALAQNMKKLTPRQLRVLELRYGLGNEREHTQEEIAGILKISRTYASRIQKGAEKKLAELMSEYKEMYNSADD